jgi:hypothetical protein
MQFVFNDFKLSPTSRCSVRRGHRPSYAFGGEPLPKVRDILGPERIREALNVRGGERLRLRRVHMLLEDPSMDLHVPFTQT